MGRKRAHAARMLARAKRRHKQPTRLVDKWSFALRNWVAAESQRSRRHFGSAKTRGAKGEPTSQRHLMLTRLLCRSGCHETTGSPVSFWHPDAGATREARPQVRSGRARTRPCTDEGGSRIAGSWRSGRLPVVCLQQVGTRVELMTGAGSATPFTANHHTAS